MSAPVAVFLFCCFASLGVGRATAPPAVETVRAWVASGVEAFRAERFAEALVEFRRAEPHAAALGARAAVRFNIARCLDELGRSADAIAAFERYLAFPDKPAPRRRAVARIQALVAQTYGTLDVRCDPPGAGLKAAGPTPKAGACPANWQRLLPGEYAIAMFVAGKAVDRRTVAVTVGETARVELRHQDGALAVTATVPGATIYVDGRAMGTSPATVPLPPGEHAVRVIALGYRPWRAVVEVSAAKTVTVRAALQAWKPTPAKQPVWRTVLPWALAGASTASLVAGGVLFARGQDAETDAARTYARYRAADGPTEAAALRDQTRAHDRAAASDRRWALGLFGAGAAFAAASVWAFMGRDQLTATGGADGFGLGWRIRW